jgi:hypothetical protein
VSCLTSTGSQGGGQRQDYQKLKGEDLAEAGVSTVDALENVEWIS